MGREVPAEEFVVAVVFSPGEEFAHDDVGVRDCAFSQDVVKIAVEPDEGVEAEAGFDDTLDDLGRFRWVVRCPVLGDGFGRGSWGCLVVVIRRRRKDYRDCGIYRIGWDSGISGNPAHFLSFPVI